jgi:hypothetical protein
MVRWLGGAKVLTPEVKEGKKKGRDPTILFQSM